MSRAFAILVALATMFVGSCSTEERDVSAILPQTIGGVAIAYNRSDGDKQAGQMPAIAVGVAEELGVPLQRVTYLTGFRDNRSTYNSDIIWVRGVDRDKLLEAVIAVGGFTGERRIDQIAGKRVVRAATPGWTDSLDETPYFYAFDDVAIIVVGDLRYVDEALQSLP